MAKQKDDHVVIALFEDRDAAKSAEESVKQWDKSDDDVKLGDMGIIFTKGDKVKTHLDHMYDIGGTFFKKDTGLTSDEIDKIGKALDDGQVAVVVTCTEDDVPAVSKELTKAGGTVTDYAVKDGAMTAAASGSGSSSTAASSGSGKSSGGSAASSSSGSGKSPSSSGSSS